MVVAICTMCKVWTRACQLGVTHKSHDVGNFVLDSGAMH